MGLADIALVENNARHGGLLATELNNLKRMGCSASSATMVSLAGTGGTLLRDEMTLR